MKYSQIKNIQVSVVTDNLSMQLQDKIVSIFIEEFLILKI